jgi:hypothetical protein
MTEIAVVTSLAGGGQGTVGSFADGSGTSAGFFYPRGVAVDASNIIIVADRDNHRLRKVTMNGCTRLGWIVGIVTTSSLNRQIPTRSFWGFAFDGTF